MSQHACDSVNGKILCYNTMQCKRVRDNSTMERKNVKCKNKKIEEIIQQLNFATATTKMLLPRH